MEDFLKSDVIDFGTNKYQFGTLFINGDLRIRIYKNNKILIETVNPIPIKDGKYNYETKDLSLYLRNSFAIVYERIQENSISNVLKRYGSIKITKDILKEYEKKIEIENQKNDISEIDTFIKTLDKRINRNK